MLRTWLPHRLTAFAFLTARACSPLRTAPGLLADLGADVIRVDHPDVHKGDMVRIMGPFAEPNAEAGDAPDDARSLTFIGLNHGKGSVALDLKIPNTASTS